MSFNSIKFLPIVAGLLLAVSCSQEYGLSSENEGKSSFKEATNSPSANYMVNNTSSNSISWEETPESLVEELTIITESANELSADELRRTDITIITMESGNYLFTQTLHNNPVPAPVPGAIVCAGSGYSFATCCGDWLEANPAGCLTICSDGNGGYTADDEGC